VVMAITVIVTLVMGAYVGILPG